MIRGEYIRADGLVIPNNITILGSGLILQGFARRAAITMWVALANCAPDQALLLDDLNEPTLGVNGYARIPVTQDSTGWPTLGTLNGESYVETDFLIWAAIGGNFDKAVNRMALCEGNISSTTGNQVISLSASMPADLTVMPTTALGLRKFKYRVYLR